jgi:hypothetical protein
LYLSKRSSWRPEMAIATYRFFPWARSGLAALLPNVEPDGPRALVSVKLALTPERLRERSVELLGPGDVIGIDTRFIVRTDPRPGAQLVEPNYLAAIDFDRPDFPWMLTPHGPLEGNMRPWLVLVVINRDRVGDPRVGREHPLPTVQLDAAAVKEELPKLDDSWAWAHVQRLSLGETDDALQLDTNPAGNVSRLLCPRRLAPNRRWLACLVPAFYSGVEAGLGQPATDEAPRPAWGDATDALTLPLYFHWTFETGPEGDFEKLAAKLTPHTAAGGHLTPEAARHARGYLGAADGTAALTAALPSGDPDSMLRFDAVLETLDRELGKPSEVPDAMASVLAAATSLIDAEGGASLGVPLNAGRIIDRDSADPSEVGAQWFDELNLDPRTRVAARVGAEAVRSVQEDLMQAAWEQVGDVLEANAQLDQSRFAVAVAERAFERHIAPLPAPRQLAVLAPAAARTRIGEGNARALVRQTSLPDRTFDTALRRTASSTSRLGRTVTRLGAATPSLPAVAEAFQRDADHADPGLLERDGAVTSNFAHAMLAERGNDSAITLPDGRQVAARLLAKADDPGPHLTLRDDLADGIRGDRNRLEFVALAAANGLSLDAVSEAADAAAPLAEPSAILVLRRDGEALKVDQIERAENGEVSLIASGGRQTLFTLATASDDEAPDPLSLARLAFNIPSGSQPGRNLTVMLHGTGRARTASFAEAALGGARGSKRRRMIRDAHRAPGIRAEPVATIGPVIGVLTPSMRGAAAAKAVREAFEAAVLGQSEPREPRLVRFDLSASADSPLAAVHSALRPSRTFAARLKAMVAIPTWLERHGDLFKPVRAGPEFQAALADFIATSAPEAFLPRDIVLPPESISALQTNPRWEAAALVGANHEINAELIWRTYPTDGRGTSLRRFWPWFDPEHDDIERITEWSAQGPLADRVGNGVSNLVIAIRGALLQRYPNTVIFAWKAAGDEKLAEIPTEASRRREVIREAQFRQFVNPDLALIGFDLTPAEFSTGWFLVLQEPITETRFGLDEEGTPEDGRRNVNNKGWTEAEVPAGGHLTLPFFGTDATSAGIANTLLQRPVRVAMHSQMLAPALALPVPVPR